MKTERMWGELAKYYDLIYSSKPYEKESEIIHRLIQKTKKTPGSQLLDVACGTGNHIQFLGKHYHISGLDLNKDMLRIVKRKFPRLKFYEEDMICFDLGRKFDIITCLFSSIGYVRTWKNLNKTISTFSRHLKTGGILIIEPFFTKENYHVGAPHAILVDEPDVKICRMNLSQRRGDIAILDFHFLVATRNGVGFLRDRHELGLFKIDKFLDILKDNGFQARFVRNGIMKGRGLYIAVKS
jgi:SAM-dependent methyltransferase